MTTRRRGRQWSDEERRRRKARGWIRWWTKAVWWGCLALVVLLLYETSLVPPHHLWWYQLGALRWVVLVGALGGFLATSRAILLPWWRLLPIHRASGRPSGPVAASREPIPAGLRFAVLRRDGFRCAYCGRGEREGVKLHLDHVVPVARGGKTEIDNLVTACATCNVGKSATDLIGA